MQRPFWFAQALADDPTVLPPLIGQTRADVCIVGGGYTGLWTAIRIKQQAPQLDVVLLEADTCGAGASGRNGGCMLSWATKLLTLERLFGEAEAKRLVRASENAIADIEAFTRKHAIDCDLRRDGVLFTATNAAQLGNTDDAIAALARRGLNSYTTLPRDEVARRAGSRQHLGGVFSPHGATVQPGKLVRGLRRVALEMGVRIHEQSAMTALDEGEVPCVRTAAGEVRAGKVVLALNAWMASAFPQFKRSIVVVSSDMVITEPRPERLTTIGLTSGVAVLDSRTFVYYYHGTSDGRIMLGKGGNTFAYDARMLPVFDQPSPYLRPLTDALARFFPEFADVPVAASWNGPSDRSATGLPFFGRLGRHPAVFYGLGYSGNGVAPSFLGGQILSSLALGEDNAWTRSGLTHGPRGRFPPEPLRYVGSLLVRNAIRRKELAQDRDRTPWFFDRALARLADAAGKADHPGAGARPDGAHSSSRTRN
jgi:putative aminophosphonate oxidoreductase